jgi:hypothetical protein
MNNPLIKIHVGLFNFLKVELKKKRTMSQLIYFFQDVIKGYVKVMLHEYKMLFQLFDKDYRIQKAKYDKVQKLKQQLETAIKLLQIVDERMAEMGAPRHYRRQFWRDFQRDGKVRKELFEELIKQMK